jgi:hypothetical protein
MGRDGEDGETKEDGEGTEKRKREKGKPGCWEWGYPEDLRPVNEAK